MDGKAGFIILIAIVAFLSLSLSLLAGYVFFVPSHQAAVAEHTEAVEKPTDEELSKLKLFEEKKVFNLKPDENNKSTMLQISAELVYFKEVPGLSKPLEKLTNYLSGMRELVSTYFLSVEPAEVKSPEGREKIKVELVKRLNSLLKENEKSKNDIIFNIVFDDWVFM